MFPRHRNLIILAAVVLAQLLVLAYQLRRDQNVPLIRYGTVVLVSPVQKTLHWTVNGISNLWWNYVGLWGTRRENEQLHRELNQLKLDNQRLRSAAAQAERLQVLFDFQQQASFTAVAAQVIGSESAETSRLLLLDKGENAGIRPDLPVIVPDGVVGKVLHVFPNAAQVLLLTDANSGVAGLLEGSRVHGVLKGANQPLGLFAYVPDTEKVEIGDGLVTSGEDKIYPKGLPVGVVVSVRPDNNFQHIEVQPFARLNRLEEVLVLLGESPGEPARSESQVATLAHGSSERGNPPPESATGTGRTGSAAAPGSPNP